MDLRRLLHHLGVETRRFAQRDQLAVVAAAQRLRGKYEVFFGKIAQIDHRLVRLGVTGGQGHDDLLVQQQPRFDGVGGHGQLAHEADVGLTGHQRLGLGG